MDGKRVAGELLDQAAKRVKRIVETTGITPCLATVLVGDDPASITYTNMKRKRCEAIGMQSRKIEMPASSTTQDVVRCVTDLGADPQVSGILLQHPAPAHVDERAAFEAIPVGKDVDGVTFGSFAHMWFGEPGFASCTPEGIVRLMDAYDVEMQGKYAVVIGRSAILGKPMAGLLLNRNATITICHSKTRNIGEIVKQADIIVAAVGRANFVQGEWVKDGAIVMDAGYNAGNVGDVDFEPAAAKASLITPVPGGVGPMTIATLIEQTVTAAERQHGVK